VSETHHIYLIPGFFGFINFGRLVYFGHVRDALERSLDGQGTPAEIHRVRVSPTASLRKRAAEIARNIAETSPGGPIHLIGHSTGGLDARLLCTPGVDLAVDGVDVEALAQRVRTIVTVSAPHYGTPLASFFTGLLGQKLLHLLSLATVAILREGRLPLSLLARVGAALARFGLPGSQTEAILDHLEAELLGRLSPDERYPVSQFFRAIGEDQGLLPQLTPDGIDLFNAAAADRPGVRYGCVVSCARRPRWVGHFKLGTSPTRQATFLLYRWLHDQTGGAAVARLPRPKPDQLDTLRRMYGSLPRPDDSDGVVPVYSQLWGEVLHAARGDHLDVIGHYGDERATPPRHDWLITGSHFDAPAFDALWNAVSAFLAPNRRRWRFGS
jgi:hypothetical protein